MANYRTTQVVTAPSQAYAQADRRRALADALQKRAIAPRDMSGMQGSDPYLLGLTQLGEALMARYAGKGATQAELAADAQMRDVNSAAIEKLAGPYQIESLDVGGQGTPLAGGSLPGSKIQDALAGMDPRQANQIVSQALLQRAIPQPLDPDKAAQRELTREQLRASQEQFKLTLEQRAREAEQRSQDAAATREQRAEAARQANDIRIQLGRMSADSAKYAADARREAVLAKIEADKKNAPGTTSADSAVGFLQNAGYDPKTGEDDITKLLDKSSGGLIRKGVNAAARAVNVTTDTMEAGATLKSRASEAVLDFLGGKLGAGVSNADRDFMMQRAGDIGNDSLTDKERKAAWLDVRKRMERASGAGQSAPTSTSAPAEEKTIVRRGKLNGRNVVQYSDGTTDYAD